MEYQYKLKDPFEYMAGGDMAKAQFITMSPPGNKHIANIAPVKASLMKALQWAQTQDIAEEEDSEAVKKDIAEEGDDTLGISPESMMNTLQLAPDIDVANVILNVRTMLTSKLGQVDGEYKLTKELWDEKLSIRDAYGLTGAFIVNFIMPSL